MLAPQILAQAYKKDSLGWQLHLLGKRLGEWWERQLAAFLPISIIRPRNCPGSIHPSGRRSPRRFLGSGGVALRLAPVAIFAPCWRLLPEFTQPAQPIRSPSN
ncbi:MAG: hypothetical protein HC890_14330 [Chloroflexaceae bacterium]|nr:hypothetical protein [Chloroflexaceae bacterium]